MLRTNITVLLLLICLFTFSVVVVVELPIDCILSFLFPAETDVLVPVLYQSTDVVVVNFVVVLKFPNIDLNQMWLPSKVVLGIRRSFVVIHKKKRKT